MTDPGNISRYLRISAYCFLCNRPFSTDHAPVAIRACGHIFGYRCLSIILNGGDVDVKATWSDVSLLAPKGAECPECNVPIAHIDSEQRAQSILRDISSDLPDQRNKLHSFVEQLRESVAKEDPNVEPKDYMQFFRRCYTSDGDDILQKALQDAASAGDYFSPFHDAITASRASDPQPMGFALLRFCYLLWDAHHAMRRKSSVSINVLLWEGNRCLGVENPLVHWEDVEEAAEMEDTRLFPLLHCFTMLVSQALARNNLVEPWVDENRVELARKFACECVGPHFEGRPGELWLVKLAVVVNELKRHQFEKGRRPLAGGSAERSVVRGWWALGNMEAEIEE